jgi:hypothetical protein
MVYLLIKTHEKTGLKYLCKHEAQSFSDCERYSGSGTYWKLHLKKHGKHIKTECVFMTEDKNEFKKVALEYSLKYDVINSKEWANLCNEEGQGGNTVIDKKLHGEKTKLGQRNPISRKKHLDHIEKYIKIIQSLAARAAKEKLKGVPKTEEHKNNMRGKRGHVNQTGSKNNNSKSIITPFGVYGSIKDAAKQIEGYTYKMIWDRLQQNGEWRYL